MGKAKDTQDDRKQIEEDSKLVNYWHDKFKQSMIHKSKETMAWHDYWDAYTGEYYRKSDKPDYKSDQISNFIFSTIETIRPIMVDGDPAFVAMATSEDGLETQDKIQTALDHEFDREEMGAKIPRQTITSLVLGTSIWFLPWDGDASSDYDGEIKAVEVNPFNFFPDPMATCIEDAEHLIYATYKHVNQLKKVFPSKANLLEGGNIKYEELVANRNIPSRVDNQVLVLEIWCRDFATTEEETEENGKTYKVEKMKYPNGRVITIAPELDALLEDKENPYNDGKFPFVMIKDYDIPFKFWGEGEVAQLISPQDYINDLSNQVIDNAKITANMPWIVDKNSGIGYGKLTNRPGLVIRKNPGSEVHRPQPPSMPNYVMNKIDDLKHDMESISGVHDVTQGKRPTGIQAGNAIMALQEAGQARIRIKVKLMEHGLSKLATMWYNRMQQFWKLDRWVRISTDDGMYDFSQITSEDLKNDYDVKINAGSTMQKNRAGMLDLLIRLGQTTAEDGLPVIDRESILEFVDIKDKSRLVKKFSELAEQNNINDETAETVGMMSEQLEQQVQEISSILEEVTNVMGQMDKEVSELYSFHNEQREEESMPEQVPQEQQVMQEDMGGSLPMSEEEMLNENQMQMPLDQMQQPSPEMEQMGAEGTEVTAYDIYELAMEEELSDQEIELLAEEYGIPIEEIIAVFEQMASQQGQEEMPQEPMISDEILQMIDALSEEELMELLEARPDIIDMIGNNQ